MSLDAPVLTPAPTAPHSRVHHIFYSAPVIQQAFHDFLEKHPESNILENERTVKTLCRAYVLGLKLSPDFWKRVTESDQGYNIISQLELLRIKRGKLRGRRPWEHFLIFVRMLCGVKLPSRKVRNPIIVIGSDAESMTRNALISIALKLYVAKQIPPRPPKAEFSSRPRRISGRITRSK